jgi:hypothetical protein
MRMGLPCRLGSPATRDQGRQGCQKRRSPSQDQDEVRRLYYLNTMRKWVDLDGKLILQLLTDHSGLTWRDLYDATGLGKLPGSPGLMSFYNCLQVLAKRGLIIVDNVPQEETVESISYIFHDTLEKNKIRASPLWSEIQMALNMKWMGVPNSRDAHSMLVAPFFGAPMSLPAQADIFVLMPFSDAFRPIYTDHISKVGKSLNLTCARADDFFTSHELMGDVWSGICGAGVVVADCTGRNPNVFYELGIAHTVGKPVIVITQSSEDIPVDIRSVRYIHYNYTPRGMADFEIKLKKTIETTMDFDHY